MQSVYLDTAIATIFVVLLFSVLTYSIQEWLAAVKQLRGKMLEKAIFDAFNDSLNKSFGVLIYEHPNIDLLKRNQDSLPAYMPSANFATALIDLISKESTTVSYVVNAETKLLEEKVARFSNVPYDNFKAGVETLNHSDLKVLLQSFLLSTNTYTDLQNTIEIWFNQYMDRVSGWYRKKTSYTVGFIAALLVLVFNFDAIFLVKRIYNDSNLRGTLVAGAANAVNHPDEINAVLGKSIEKQISINDAVWQAKIKIADSTHKGNPDTLRALNAAWLAERNKIADSARVATQQQIKKEIETINGLNLPIGWKVDDNGIDFASTFRAKGRPVWSILLGWVLAGVLISFGAPFWFNLLIKLVPLRKAGVKPAAESSKK